MSDEPRDDRIGELNRRWRLLLKEGHLAALGSEGRLTALYVLHMANWRTCQLRLSARRAAVAMGVRPTTVRRGIAQMIEVGILRVLDKQGENRVRWFEVVRCARSVSTVDTGCVHNSISLPDSPPTIRESTSEASPSAGRLPAEARRQSLIEAVRRTRRKRAV